MITLPQHLFERLKANGEASARDERDHVPVVKFFDPSGAATWLITEVDPADNDLLFGLCDLGMGFPEIGHVLFSELNSVQGRLGIGLERDLHFQGKHPLSVYTHAARRAERIVEDEAALEQSAEILAREKSSNSEKPDA